MQRMAAATQSSMNPGEEGVPTGLRHFIMALASVETMPGPGTIGCSLNMLIIRSTIFGSNGLSSFSTRCCNVIIGD